MHLSKRNIFLLRVYILGLLFIVLHIGIWIMPNIGAEYTISQYYYNPTVLMTYFKDPMSQFLYVWGGIPYAISLIPSDINLIHLIHHIKGFNWNYPWILNPH